MICSSCSKLSFVYTTKKCVKCSGEAITTLSILCDTCAKKDKVCAVCLKKVDSTPIRNKLGGCRCGGG